MAIIGFDDRKYEHNVFVWFILQLTYFMCDIKYGRHGTFPLAEPGWLPFYFFYISILSN